MTVPAGSESSKSTTQSDSAVVETTAVSGELTLKQKAGDAANRWMARNRSLVLRQTPVWAQSLAAILIGLSTTAVLGGIFFRIDEVVTVQGQLKSIGGTVEVKTPAGGRVAEVLFSDGEAVTKGQLCCASIRVRQPMKKKLSALDRAGGEPTQNPVGDLAKPASNPGWP